VEIYEETVIRILLKCQNLKCFHTLKLLDAITILYKYSMKNEFETDNIFSLFNLSKIQNKLEKFCGTLKLETVHVDHLRLKSEQMESLSIICPLIKTLNINCIGESNNLAYLCNFSYLTELLIANTSCLMSYKFETYLLNAFKGSLGKQLKSLHLTYLVDVNLRSLAKYCRNLQKLIVEFISYYEPAIDTSLSESDLSSDIITREIGMPNLRILSISNLNNKYEHHHLNIGQFKKDLKLLISNANIATLSLNGLDELENEYFAEIFTTPVPIYLSDRNSSKKEFIIDSIETMEFHEINNLTSEIFYQALKNHNSLRKLNLINCRLINKRNYFEMVKLVKVNNLDCEINWK
jgi:hypothetical protein